MEECEFVGYIGGYGWLVFFFPTMVDGVGMGLLH